MIIFKRLGYTIKLSNLDWHSIRERFDLGKAKLDNEGEHYVIKTPCFMCKKYHKPNDCGDCPIYKVLGEEFGRGSCTDLVESFFPDKEPDFNLESSEVWWSIFCDKEARRELKALNKIMDKIEEENGKT